MHPKNHTWSGRIQAQDEASGNETGEATEADSRAVLCPRGGSLGFLQQAGRSSGFSASSCLMIHTGKAFSG